MSASEGALWYDDGPSRAMAPPGGSSLADVLERVLDKGIVVAGDVAINLLDIELLTIKVRLLIASADKAKELGIDWWSRDPSLSGTGQPELTVRQRELEQRLRDVETRLRSLSDGESGGDGRA
jgi:hypothetical protein